MSDIIHKRHEIASTTGFITMCSYVIVSTLILDPKQIRVKSILSMYIAGYSLCMLRNNSYYKDDNNNK